MRHWWHRLFHRRMHERFCVCQITGYLWYADGQVWALSPKDVEVVTGVQA